jgi:hypothetical protein
MGDDAGLLQMVENAMDAGAAGIAIGRNVWQHKNPWGHRPQPLRRRSRGHVRPRSARAAERTRALNQFRFSKTMKRLLLAASLLAALPLHAQQLQTFEIKADDWAEGEPPKEVFVVDGTIKIAAREGNKAIVIDPAPITDASAQLAVSAAGNAIIEARIFATKRGRSTPRFGVSVHGMSGYRLLVNPAKKALELAKNDQTIATVPFTGPPMPG